MHEWAHTLGFTSAELIKCTLCSQAEVHNKKISGGYEKRYPEVTDGLHSELAIQKLLVRFPIATVEKVAQFS